jgi:CRISPR-associated protein Cas2
MRIMRMLVLFDLPTGSKSERKSYATFRKFLIKDGYHMEQFSVYSRVLLSRDSADAHLKRLKANLPEAGEVTVITLTEKQYESREVLVHTRMGGSQVVDPGSQMTLAF